VGSLPVGDDIANASKGGVGGLHMRDEAPQDRHASSTPDDLQEKSVGELRPKLPNQSEKASKSKVRQTVGLEI
jgi:hypothetical protein